MKHLQLLRVFNQRLKLFEGFGKEEYYTQLDWNEFPFTNHPMMKKMIDFPIDIFSKVEPLFNVCKLCKWGVEDGRRTYVEFMKNGRGYIIAFQDEWFVIFWENKYWRCDQWEGLREFLRDKLSSKMMESFNKEDYYKQVPYEDTIKDLGEFNEEQMTSEEIEYIMGKFPPSKCRNYMWLYKDKKRNLSGYTVFKKEFEPNKVIYGISFMTKQINLCIIKKPDEYFSITLAKYGVRDDEKYTHYVCDQFDGLKRFIEDLEKRQRIFESNYSKDEYYKSISHEEYIDLLNNRKLKDRSPKIKQGMSIKDIFKSMNPYDDSELEQIGEVCGKYNLNISQPSDSADIIVSNRHSKVEMVIYKLDDEYYLVSLQSLNPGDQLFWKCDQLDGLIMFIDDNGSKWGKKWKG
jgi:hypothetical protein